MKSADNAQLPPCLTIMHVDVVAIVQKAAALAKLGQGHPFVFAGFAAQRLLQFASQELPRDAKVDAEDSKFHRACCAAYRAFRLEMDSGIELATSGDMRRIQLGGS